MHVWECNIYWLCTCNFCLLAVSEDLYWTQEWKILYICQLFSDRWQGIYIHMYMCMCIFLPCMCACACTVKRLSNEFCGRSHELARFGYQFCHFLHENHYNYQFLCNLTRSRKALIVYVIYFMMELLHMFTITSLCFMFFCSWELLHAVHIHKPLVLSKARHLCTQVALPVVGMW